jgi:hypothetical protein
MSKWQAMVLIFFTVLVVNVCGCSANKQLIEHEISGPLLVDPSKSYVFFYRPCIVRSTTKAVLIQDKIKSIGIVNCGAYIVYETEPGKHTFNANDWMGHDHPLKMELAAGEKYFIEIDLRVSFMDSISPMKVMDDVTENDLTELRRVSGK